MNSENRKFEESWKNAFSDAEMNPSEEVWDGIDLHLSKTESDNMKRRVVFYQRLTAASLLFALLAGGAGVWNWVSEDRQLTDSETQRPKPITKKSIFDANTQGEATNSNKGINESNLLAGKSTQRNASSSEENGGVGDNNKDRKSASSKDRSNHNSLASSAGDELLNRPTIVKDETDIASSTTLAFPTISSEMLPEVEIKLTGEPVRKIPNPKPFKDPVIIPKKDLEDGRGWWASVGGAAGSYSPNTSASANFSQVMLDKALSASSAVPDSHEASIGTAYSYGISIGKKISKKWVIVTGLNHLNQSIGYNTNVAALNANHQAQAFVADLNTQFASLTTTTPYTINSVRELLSIPLQAGYVFLDKKIGFQLNAGVSTDFFIKNTLVDEAGKLASYSVGAGDHSAYRTINWTGLASIELSYRVSSQYRVSVLPGLRYGLNPVLKSGETFPVIWEVGFRFGYLF